MDTHNDYECVYKCPTPPPDDHLLMDSFPSLVDAIDVFHVKEEWFVKGIFICCLFSTAGALVVVTV